MELTLNLVWLATALLLLRLWIGQAARGSREMRLQLLALTLLLAVLFPVISVTDDLQTVQGTVETEGCGRRDHSACAHPGDASQHAAAPVAAFETPGLSHLGMVAPVLHLSSAAPSHPGLRLQNRPPPAA
jgi:hypothetical protein